MKNILFYSCLLLATITNLASAQTVSHIKLSDPKPSVGKNIIVTYDPAGTPLDGKKELEGLVYFFDGKNYPVADLDFAPEGKLLKATFTIPNNTKAFFIKVSKYATVDNNNGKGYIYLIYKNGIPVQRAYATKGNILNGRGQTFASIPRNEQAALADYKKEYALYPSNKDDLLFYAYSLLYTAKDVKGVAKIAKELAATGDKEQMSNAVKLYQELKRSVSADSLLNVIKTKFADAQKSELETAFDKEENPAKKEELYKSYISQHPEDTKTPYTVQDNMRLQFVLAYLDAGKLNDCIRTADFVNNKANLALMLNSFVQINKSKYKPEELALIAKLAVKAAQDRLDHPVSLPYQSPRAVKKNDVEAYIRYVNTYTNILLEQNKFEEAVAVEKPAYEITEGQNEDINQRYASILIKAGKSKEAFKMMEKAYQDYKSAPPMYELFKEVYTKEKGSPTGFDEYLAGIRQSASKSVYNKVAKEMVNKPGPQFSLKDLDGNTVSLADLKGKVVVLDFWATWCAPCKASFPGMQLAVDRYKNNPNVKFLFVDVWEKDSNYIENIKDFIKSNRYSFQVLLDEKPADGGYSSKLTGQLGIKTIPSKFIIDGAGNIRFQTEGNTSTPEGLAEEVSAMIELAGHPETAKVSQ